MKTVATIGLGLVLAACSPSGGAVDNGSTPIRNLANSHSAPQARENEALDGTLIPTTSDGDARYYVVWSREQRLAGRITSVIRQERGGRLSYARIEVSCNDRLFRILGSGNRRSFAETSIRRDGPLRSMDGLVLREELARFICARKGTPLRPA